MPINASPHYEKAEAEYLNAQTTEEKIRCLKKMIALAPKHKGSENLLKQLRTRLKKLKYSNEKENKKAGATQKGIKKAEMQAIIIGFTNSGKSTLLSILTNAQPKISETNFTTTFPIIGIINYAGTQIQLIENPAIESEFYNKGITHTADTILMLVQDFEQLKELEKILQDSKNKKIIIFNTKEENFEQLRKIEERLKSKRYKNYVLTNLKQKTNLEELKNKIFISFNRIRIYTKEPYKEKSEKPVILKPNSTVFDVAEKILKGFSSKIKETKIWGPSSKFPGQKIGLKHKLKDLDIVEFKTR